MANRHFISYNHPSPSRPSLPRPPSPPRRNVPSALGVRLFATFFLGFVGTYLITLSNSFHEKVPEEEKNQPEYRPRFPHGPSIISPATSAAVRNGRPFPADGIQKEDGSFFPPPVGETKIVSIPGSTLLARNYSVKVIDRLLEFRGSSSEARLRGGAWIFLGTHDTFDGFDFR